jgi:hypothetical protein
MNYNHQNPQDKQLTLKIHPKILSSNLSFNEKLILGLHYTLSKKKGYNVLSIRKMCLMFNLHQNVVSYCRKRLINDQYIQKKDRKYIITDLYKNFETNDRREIFIPFEIYSHKNLTTGAKLLWGEYNSISRGVKQYFANRDFTAKRLNASIESITNWTKQLYDNKLLKLYTHNIGYCKSQKVVVTVDFNQNKKVIKKTIIDVDQFLELY